LEAAGPARRRSVTAEREERVVATCGCVHYISEVLKLYVRGQIRKNIAKHLRQPAASPSIAAQQPAAHHLALEAEARAVTRLLSRRPRLANTRSRRSSGPRPSLVAVIVESRRVDGRPRQHLILYIGSIDCADVHRLSARRRFWDRADIALAGLTPEERERFEQALAVKVPHPTREEEAAAAAAFAARYRLPIPATARAACELIPTADVGTVVQSVQLEREPDASSG
jgi:hypothetical protein